MSDIRHLISERCASCGIGIGVSEIESNGSVEKFHHSQIRAKIEKKKKYCDSCYEVLTRKRLNKKHEKNTFNFRS